LVNNHDRFDWSIFTPFITNATATAYIAGQYKFTSFDRNVFNFVGKCKYLLAREHVTGKYSLEADFSGSTSRKTPTKSLIFHATSDGNSVNSIEISSDYKVH
jgi:hypothetical protein